MTLTIKLDHTDHKVPTLRAHVVQGTKYGHNMLAGHQLRDPECAKKVVAGMIQQKFCSDVSIEWVGVGADSN